MIAQRTSSRAVLLALLAVATCLLQTGCLFNSRYERIERRSEPITPVEFESDFSRQRFQSVAWEESSREKETSRFSVGIPLLLGLKYRSKPSANAYYNDWVSRVDVDQDGLITDSEVASLPPTSPSIPEDWGMESEIVEIQDESGKRVITASLHD